MGRHLLEKSFARLRASAVLICARPHSDSSFGEWAPGQPTATLPLVIHAGMVWLQDIDEGQTNGRVRARLDALHPCLVVVHVIYRTAQDRKPAEQFGPWILDSKRRVIFVTLPHNGAEAITKMRGLLAGFSKGP